MEIFQPKSHSACLCVIELTRFTACGKSRKMMFPFTDGEKSINFALQKSLRYTKVIFLQTPTNEVIFFLITVWKAVTMKLLRYCDISIIALVIKEDRVSFKVNFIRLYSNKKHETIKLFTKVKVLRRAFPS